MKIRFVLSYPYDFMGGVKASVYGVAKFGFRGVVKSGFLGVWKFIRTCLEWR